MLRTTTQALIAILGAALIIAASSEPRAAEELEVFSLSKLKSQAEQWTKELKKKYRSGSAEYKKARALYFDAKASIDGWIDQVKTDIIAKRDIRLSKGAQEFQDEATEKAQRLVEYLNQLFAQGAFPGGGAIIADAAKTFANTVSQILLEFLKAKETNKKERLEGVAKQVEGLRWKPFDGI